METHGIVGRGLSVVKEVISFHVIQFEEMVDGAGEVIGVKDVANVDKVVDSQLSVSVESKWMLKIIWF